MADEDEDVSGSPEPQEASAEINGIIHDNEIQLAMREEE